MFFQSVIPFSFINCAPTVYGNQENELRKAKLAELERGLGHLVARYEALLDINEKSEHLRLLEDVKKRRKSNSDVTGQLEHLVSIRRTLTQEVASTRTCLSSLQHENSELQQSHNNILQQIDFQKTAVNQMMEQKRALVQEHEAAEQYAARTQNALKAAKTHLRQIQDYRKSLETQLTEAQKKVENSRKTVAELQLQLDETNRTRAGEEAACERTGSETAQLRMRIAAAEAQGAAAHTPLTTDAPRFPTEGAAVHATEPDGAAPENKQIPIQRKRRRRAIGDSKPARQINKIRDPREETAAPARINPEPDNRPTGVRSDPQSTFDGPLNEQTDVASTPPPEDPVAGRSVPRLACSLLTSRSVRRRLISSPSSSRRILKELRNTRRDTDGRNETKT